MHYVGNSLASIRRLSELINIDDQIVLGLPAISGPDKDRQISTAVIGGWSPSNFHDLVYVPQSLQIALLLKENTAAYRIHNSTNIIIP